MDMELSPITHNNGNMRHHSRRDDRLAGEDIEEDETPGDVYEALGYRKPVYPSITTQQWLDKRLIIEQIFA